MWRKFGVANTGEGQFVSAFPAAENTMRVETRREEPISAVPHAEQTKEKMEIGRQFGSKTTVLMVICVQLLGYCYVQAQPTTTIRPTRAPCSRLLMKGIDSDNLPWLQMSGIYLLANFTVDLFPVYKHESVDMHFYYNRSERELRFGDQYQNTSILLGAFTNGRTDSITDYYNRPVAPFTNFITGWYQFDPASRKYVALPGGRQSVEPICLPDYVATCSSGLVEFDASMKQINPVTGRITDFNILVLDYYKQIPGFYRNSRPVYTRMRGDLDTQTYLYYMEGRWLIGPNYSYSWADFYTTNSAMRPEHVLGTWTLKTNGIFVPVEAKLRCRALTDDRACDATPANRCLNRGTCLTSIDGLKKYCGCAPGYRGLYCEEQIPSCPQPTALIERLINSEGNFHYFLIRASYEGSVLTIFRSLGLQPRYWFSTCDGSSWSTTGIDILQPTTTRIELISTTTEYRYYDYTTRRYVLEWKDPTAAIVVCVMVVLMQIVIPFIIFCFIKCVSCARVTKAEHEDDAKVENLYRNYQTSLDVFRRQHPQPEEEYNAVTAAQLSRIHNNYEESVRKITKRKAARKNKGKVKCFRIFSVYAYITFWIYLLYVLLFSTTRLFGGYVFAVLFIISAILIFITYLIVLLEYKWSSERQYISNLSSSVFAAERIETMRAARPSIFHRAECYHFETRTRTVTYTDANGRLQTRLETYQERVVTNVIHEPVSFQYWKDTSPTELLGIRVKGITKIKMTLSVEPGDEETTTAISEQYSAFQTTYGHMDTYVDFSIEKHVPGFEKRLAAYTDNREKPVWVSSGFYLAATFLCLNWPYRWAFNSITSKTEFALSKLVYTSRPLENNEAQTVV